MTVTTDTTKYTADATWPSADGYVPTNIIFAEVFEPVRTGVTGDATAYTADNATWPTADGGILVGALDFTDAEVIAAVAGFWVDRISRPRRVVGVGYGVLPPLRGEAHGVVYIVGDGKATLPISGAAMGEVDDGLDELIMMLLLAA